MISKTCSKCREEKPVAEFCKRSGGSGFISACKACESERRKVYLERTRGTPIGMYRQQKSNAAMRGIEFKISFDEWSNVWANSGKMENRGRGVGKYCMCRFGDQGAYEVGNVFIGLSTENVRDGNIGRIVSDHARKKISDSNKGKPHEWSRGEKNPMHRPDVKAKISAAIGGANHYKARGVNTPQGFFVTAKAAADALGMKKPTVEWRARHNKFGFSLPA